MRTVQSTDREGKKRYQSPRLISQGHISRVTGQKSGGFDFNGPGPPFSGRSNNTGSQSGRATGGFADNFFDNYYDD